MKSSWSWLRLASLAGGVVAGAASVIFPVVAPYTAPAAAFLIGLATRAPGTADPPPPIVR